MRQRDESRATTDDWSSSVRSSEARVARHSQQDRKRYSRCVARHMSSRQRSGAGAAGLVETAAPCLRGVASPARRVSAVGHRSTVHSAAAGSLRRTPVDASGERCLEPPPNSPKTRQKLSQNRSRASEPRTRSLSVGTEVPGNAHHLPSRVTRPRGFEPLTFGSVVGASTGPRGLFPRGIACTDASIEVTRAATRGHARTRFVPTSFPPLRVADGASRLHPRAPEAAGHRRR
jgi:hypothetical protein